VSSSLYQITYYVQPRAHWATESGMKHTDSKVLNTENKSCDVSALVIEVGY